MRLGGEGVIAFGPGQSFRDKTQAAFNVTRSGILPGQKLRTNTREQHEKNSNRHSKGTAADHRRRGVAGDAPEDKTLLQGEKQVITNQAEQKRNDQPENFLKKKKKQASRHEYDEPNKRP